MKLLYLDCSMGAAGDMLMAALLELLDDREAFLREMTALGLPGVELSAQRTEKCGIFGTHMRVLVHGEEEGHPHAHPAGHSHSHHHHTSLHEIEHLIDCLSLPQPVRNDARAVYAQLAEAESAVHGVPVDQIHFHEVGTLDALCDVVGVCLLMHRLSPERVCASAVNTGCGQVRCAHGILPVPAPATARLLTGIPTYGGTIQSELCTPTGAALLRHFVSSFGTQPPMRVEKIGYGMGTKDFAAANCLRAMLGTAEGAADEVWELSCQLDDMTAEELGFAMERLFAAGALDVYTTPIGMKKNRPGTLLTCLCHEDAHEALLRAIFHHTTTLGVRETRCARRTLARTECTVQTDCGAVRIKRAEGYGTARQKAEFEDLARIARAQDCSLREALAHLNAEQKK